MEWYVACPSKCSTCVWEECGFSVIVWRTQVFFSSPFFSLSVCLSVYLLCLGWTLSLSQARQALTRDPLTPALITLLKSSVPWIVFCWLSLWIMEKITIYPSPIIICLFLFVFGCLKLYTCMPNLLFVLTVLYHYICLECSWTLYHYATHFFLLNNTVYLNTFCLILI